MCQCLYVCCLTDQIALTMINSSYPKATENSSVKNFLLRVLDLSHLKHRWKKGEAMV